MNLSVLIASSSKENPLPLACSENMGKTVRFLNVVGSPILTESTKPLIIFVFTFLASISPPFHMIKIVNNIEHLGSMPLRFPAQKARLESHNQRELIVLLP
jgi:hypothetical protein